MAKSDKKIKVTTTPITEEELLRVYFGAVSLGASSFAATYLPEIPSGHAGRLVEEMIAVMQRDPLGRETALQHARAILDGKKLEGLLLTIRLPGEGE